MTSSWCPLTNYEATWWEEPKCKSHEQRHSVHQKFTFGNIVWENLEITLVKILSGIRIMEMNLTQGNIKIEWSMHEHNWHIHIFKTTHTEFTNKPACNIKLFLDSCDCSLGQSLCCIQSLYLNWLAAAISYSRSTLNLVHFVIAFLPQLIFSWDISAWQQCGKSLSCRMGNIWPSVTQINY